MMEFLDRHSLFLVLVISVLSWAGIFLYLWKLDRKIRRLEEHSPPRH